MAKSAPFNLFPIFLAENVEVFGFIGMEGHEARAAIAALDGNLYCGKPLKVKFEEPATGKNGRRN